MDAERLEAEAQAVRGRYERRSSLPADRYSSFQPDVVMTIQERDRALIRCFVAAGLVPFATRSVFDAGCGAGGNLLHLIRLGFDPELLVGNDLQEDRLEAARRRLPAGVRLLAGDVARTDLPDESFDIVMQMTVLSSILDDEVQQTIADRLWALARPGGGIVSYDFVYDNPANPDVRGMPVRRIRELFPHATPRVWRLTLAPPLARPLARIHPAFYSALNVLRPLRTHALCWIPKP